MNYKKSLTIISITISILVVFLVSNSLYRHNTHASVSPGESVVLKSTRLDYDLNTPGSLKLDKSARWIGNKKAQIIMDLDTIHRQYSIQSNLDVLIILDISESMNGEKINKVKEDSSELIDEILNNQNNKVGLITFGTHSSIVSDLTNNKNFLINRINNLSDFGSTNYYDALKNADNLLENYEKEENRELVLLFLTDGYPNEKIPNEVEEYRILKEKHPYMTIQGIQYEMGKDILAPLESISDSQFIADMYTLENVLFDAIIVSSSYDTLEIVDYIKDDYFEVINYENTYGNVSIVGNKITWNLDNIRSGSKANLIINIKLKDNINEKNLYETNNGTNIISKINNINEEIDTEESPLLKSKLIVVYDGNLPEGCTVDNIPLIKDYYPSEIVEKYNEKLLCDGYVFKGWKILNSVDLINEDYFRVLNEDVTIRAEWSKPEISKSLDGTPTVKLNDTLLQSNSNYNKTFGKNISRNLFESITTVDSIEIPANAIDLWDVSVEQNGSILAWYTNIDNNRYYELYIGQDGGVMANPDCSYLFYEYSNLKTVDLDNLNTTNVTNMSHMFRGCTALTSLDLRPLNTENVTNMSYMFSSCNVTILDLSPLNTENVINMSNMFNGCTVLTSLDLRPLNTENVTNMASMFSSCHGLTSLDLSPLNTANVTDMSGMFDSCRSLTSVTIDDSFNTINVTDMSYMFHGCYDLTSLDLSPLNTENVVNMSYMFSGCSGLTNITFDDSFNTINVTNMAAMFNGCNSLVNLDLSFFNTQNVATMKEMFNACKSLSDLIINSFNTIKVTDMAFMFYKCENLTNLELNHFKTNEVTTMNSMFRECVRLIKIDMSGWDTTKVTNMNSMFYRCIHLVEIDVSSSWNVSKVTDSSGMFLDCTQLVGGNGTAFVPSIIDKTYARIDTPVTPGYLTRKEESTTD